MDAAGNPIDRIDTPQGAEVVLEEGSGAGDQDVFRFPGTYPVLLVVTDDAGRQGSDTATATIQ